MEQEERAKGIVVEIEWNGTSEYRDDRNQLCCFLRANEVFTRRKTYFWIFGIVERIEI